MEKEERSKEIEVMENGNDKGVVPTGLLSRLIGDGSSVQVGKDMIWPKIGCHNMTEWIMRYGEDSEVLEKRFYAASVIASYKALIKLPQDKRNKICKAIQEAT